MRKRVEIKPSGKNEKILEFVEWASKYDDADINIMSKALHTEWLSLLQCSVIRLDGDLSVQERVDRVLKVIKQY